MKRFLAAGLLGGCWMLALIGCASTSTTRETAEACTAEPSAPPGEVYEAEAVDEIPDLIGGLEALNRRIPASAAVRPGSFSRVVLDFVVDATGCVRDIRARSVESERGTPEEIAQPFIEALRQMRFRPGTKGGAAVAVRMAMPFSTRR